MTPRIHLRLALMVGCLVVAVESVALLSLGRFFYRHFSAEVNLRLEEALIKPSALLARGALSTDAFGQRDTLASVVGPSLDDAMIVSADGVILVALATDRVGRRWGEYPELEAGWLQRAVHGGFNERVVVGDHSYLIRVAPVTANGRDAPLLFDYVRIRTTDNERELAALRRNLVGGMIAGIVITVLTLMLGVHFLITRRLHRIALAVGRVADGNYESVLGRVELPDEIGFLETGIEGMTRRLREAFAGMHNALAELELAEQKYRVLVENADEGIVVLQDGMFAFANSKSRRMFVQPGERLAARQILEFVHPDDRTMIQTALTRQMSGAAGMERFEFRIATQSGSTVWLDLNAVGIEWRGAPATLVFLRDIDQRKQHEQERDRLQSQLVQAQKMESIGRLAGGIAHDFNNMLQVILGNVSLALSELPAGDPSAENIVEVEKAARRSAELVNHLLAFARKQTIAPRVLDLNAAIEGMLKMLRRLIGEHINLVWLPGATVAPIHIDPSQVDQILANLCANARDVIDGAGRISIETCNVHIDDTYAATHPDVRPGHYVMLSVSDNGRGMDAETRAHIFEPFFTTKEVGYGTGLGLATVFGIVKQNQGLINVYSELGRGSTFKLYFPRCAAGLTAEPELAHVDGRGTETILLVEDEEPILKLGRKILQRHGYTVLTAARPQEALELATRYEGPIHLLITDVVMPNMNGKELREQLVARQRAMKCLFMSGYTADIIAHHGVLDEGIEFIQKPFTNRSFAAKVHQVLHPGPIG